MSDTRQDLYRGMRRIRSFEARTSELYRGGEIPGFVHVSIGQEAVAIGACWPLRRTDVVTSNHRGHGHVLAKGGDMKAMFAELMARETGMCRGRGGSMHIADIAVGIFGANGIVAAGLPIAVGAATSIRRRNGDEIVVAFFGDGAVGQGAFHESINMAAIKRLPIVFLCENNQFAEFSSNENLPAVSLSCRAGGYGVPYVYADGNDVESVANAMGAAVARARAGDGPVFLEAETYRVRGHYEGDPQKYRADDVAEWLTRDPLTVLANRMLTDGVPQGELARIDAEVDAEVEAAVEFAQRSAPPRPQTVRWYVTAGGQESARLTELQASGREGVEEIRTSRAIGLALRHELEDDSRVFLAGIDMVAGNVFGLTRGLADDFPGRLIDTPISETALMGLGVGAAMSGDRPIIELMYLDFLGVCLDQLMNQAAKMRFMTGGAAEVPMTIRTQFGAGRSSGSQHSQSLEAILAHIPGLKVCMPSTAADAYGMIRAAVQDPNPVVVIENRLLYETMGPAPPRGYRTPMGKALVVRDGSDITLVSISRMVRVCIEVAEQLEADGVDCEVIDLRSISPLDHGTVLTSVAKTSRLLIAHEAVTDFGIGAELAARVAHEGFTLLDAPIGRVGSLPMPAPYAPNLEALWLPTHERIRAAIRDVMRF